MSFTLHFQLHPVKSSIFCFVAFFYKLLNEYFRLKYMPLKDIELTISKLQTASFYQKNFRSYKLLDMTAPKKTRCTVRAFSFKNKGCNPICKL